MTDLAEKVDVINLAHPASRGLRRDGAATEPTTTAKIVSAESRDHGRLIM